MVPRSPSLAMFVTGTLGSMHRTGEWDRWAAALDAVASTLGHLDDPTFGTCRTCGADIAIDVVTAEPDADRCTACATTPR